MKFSSSLAVLAAASAALTNAQLTGYHTSSASSSVVTHTAFVTVTVTACGQSSTSLRPISSGTASSHLRSSSRPASSGVSSSVPSQSPSTSTIYVPPPPSSTSASDAPSSSRTSTYTGAAAVPTAFGYAGSVVGFGALVAAGLAL